MPDLTSNNQLAAAAVMLLAALPWAAQSVWIWARGRKASNDD